MPVSGVAWRERPSAIPVPTTPLPVPPPLPQVLIEELYMDEPEDPITAMIEILEKNPQLGAALPATVKR